MVASREKALPTQVEVKNVKIVVEAENQVLATRRNSHWSPREVENPASGVGIDPMASGPVGVHHEDAGAIVIGEEGDAVMVGRAAF